MPAAGARLVERTLSHLSATLEQAEQANRAAEQSIDPRVKVGGAVMLTFAAVSSRRLDILAGLLLLLTTVALRSGISWRRLLVAWAGGLFFAAVVALPAIFTNGWHIALLLVSRSEVSLTCWLLVIMSTPFNRVLKALRAFHVPVVFIAILSMTFRYIFLFVETARDMLLSRRSRIVGRLSGADNRRLLVSSIGVLLGKSIQMSDDVYQAMTSRGFRGKIYLLQEFAMRTRDWIALAAIAALSAATFMIGR
jgi:cobalt/nickel transport system permease protein